MNQTKWLKKFLFIQPFLFTGYVGFQYFFKNEIISKKLKKLNEKDSNETLKDLNLILNLNFNFDLDFEEFEKYLPLFRKIIKSENEDLQIKLYSILIKLSRNQYFSEQSSFVILKPTFDILVQTENKKLKKLCETFILNLVSNRSTHQNFLKWSRVYTFMVEHHLNDFLMSKLIGKLYQNDEIYDLINTKINEDEELTFASLIYILANSKDELARYYAKTASLIMKKSKNSKNLIDKREFRSDVKLTLMNISIFSMIGISWISMRYFIRQFKNLKEYNLKSIKKYLKLTFQNNFNTYLISTFSTAFIFTNFFIFERNISYLNESKNTKRLVYFYMIILSLLGINFIYFMALKGYHYITFPIYLNLIKLQLDN
eukprot:gene1122-10636_t